MDSRLGREAENTRLRNKPGDKNGLKNRQNMEGIFTWNLLSLCEFLKQYL
jgi:hypothetical protein